MGPAVLPFLFAELEARMDHWFWPLGAITRVNPVADDDAGDVRAMADAWLDWARVDAYLG